MGGIKMKKAIGLLAVLIGIMILTACNNSDSENKNSEVKIIDLPAVEVSENLKEEAEAELSPLDLTSEEGIREYLAGEWFCQIEYMSNIVVNMKIYQDLDVELSFKDSFTEESKGDYKGKIIFDRVYANPDEAPDIISIELDDSKYPKGDFFFLHRTLYDGKRVMSLFFTGNGKSVFDILIGYDGDDYDYTIEEVMLEKITGEISTGNARKNDAFYAVFWEHGVLYESIWLDDVDWTPSYEDDIPTKYPRQMEVYENDKYESILYNVNPDKKFEILGDNMFKGTVYYVETDNNGNLIELIDADYKKYLEESPEDYIDSEIEDLIFDIIINDIEEVQAYLDDGLSILFTGETTVIDGEECYDVALGRDYEDQFVREIHYAVNINSRQVYRLDIINDVWEIVGAG